MDLQSKEAWRLEREAYDPEPPERTENFNAAGEHRPTGTAGNDKPFQHQSGKAGGTASVELPELSESERVRRSFRRLRWAAFAGKTKGDPAVDHSREYKPRDMMGSDSTSKQDEQAGASQDRRDLLESELSRSLRAKRVRALAWTFAGIPTGSRAIDGALLDHDLEGSCGNTESDQDGNCNDDCEHEFPQGNVTGSTSLIEKPNTRPVTLAGAKLDYPEKSDLGTDTNESSSTEVPFPVVARGRKDREWLGELTSYEHAVDIDDHTADVDDHPVDIVDYAVNIDERAAHPKSRYKRILSALYEASLQFLRPRIPKGHQRITWICVRQLQLPPA